ncbi:uncharacterized protein LOC127260327 [Andrographis paniculata]|uniref:uncharacterized protein LOC127260327 n=1 Tax=Andrographis paniculata TaxID=175694 RepID=UPI0021E707D7|nr:uncharacterized protein LOC127260327 [Andrographis paniculata]
MSKNKKTVGNSSSHPAQEAAPLDATSATVGGPDPIISLPASVLREQIRGEIRSSLNESALGMSRYITNVLKPAIRTEFALLREEELRKGKAPMIGSNPPESWPNPVISTNSRITSQALSYGHITILGKNGSGEPPATVRRLGESSTVTGQTLAGPSKAGGFGMTFRSGTGNSWGTGPSATPAPSFALPSSGTAWGLGGTTSAAPHGARGQANTAEGPFAAGFGPQQNFEFAAQATPGYFPAQEAPAVRENAEAPRFHLPPREPILQTPPQPVIRNPPPIQAPPEQPGGRWK